LNEISDGVYSYRFARQVTTVVTKDIKDQRVKLHWLLALVSPITVCTLLSNV